MSDSWRLLVLLSALLVFPAALPAAPPGRDDLFPDPKLNYYDQAILEAFQRFVCRGELTHAAAILERHPELVNARRQFRQPHKPSPGDDSTALQLAVLSHHAGVAEYLLSKSADPNAKGDHGWRPIHWAAESGDLKMVKLLVTYKADVCALTSAYVIGRLQGGGATEAISSPARQAFQVPPRT